VGYRPKRLAAAVGLLTAHGDAVEADLQRWYGVDVRDLYRGGLTYRRLLVLVENLPADSAVAAIVAKEVQDPQAPEYERQWTISEHMLAAILDQLAVLSWLQIAATVKNPPPAPKPIRRPGEKSVQVRRLSAEERAMIDRINLGGQQ
jgi:hypothetical protein